VSYAKSKKKTMRSLQGVEVHLGPFGPEKGATTCRIALGPLLCYAGPSFQEAIIPLVSWEHVKG
jgi:hypothetical protein